ncbi:MAG TPA: energy transducer TonB [Flavobacteriaceae bacterium]|nr:energy transducer TonB [Flavobacteriaceae bacterium]MCB9212281.1 energy transducer TonB [Alteromonas sp.]HPF10340.1 energy transducer TonB [Flavobacteriaceae bacterium]HQU20404.1 energy transducer TonB [Flavobacteriaceae bacterium]HQU65742.1 energy transducer TonB [Flavobacteriaceae bacterium]
MKTQKQNSEKTSMVGLSKLEEKKRINIRWNATLYFQVGLIVSLLAMFWIVETKWEVAQLALDNSNDRELWIDPPTIDFTIDEPKPVEVKKNVVKQQVVKQQVVATTITPVKSNTLLNEDTVPTTEVKTDIPLPSTTTVIADPKPAPKDLLSVQQAPIFPGCESLSTNEARRACFQEKVREFISKKFDTDPFVDKYSGETKRINVQFTVDSNGLVSNIRAASANEDLTNEAKRVVARLPKMTPGKQDSKSVEVLYTLPIVLRIDY